MCAALVGGGAGEPTTMGSPSTHHPHAAFSAIGLRGSMSGHHGPPAIPPNNNGPSIPPDLNRPDPPPDVLLALLSRNRALEGSSVYFHKFCPKSTFLSADTDN